MTLRIALLAALLTTATMVLLVLGVGTAGAQGGGEEEETFFNCVDCILEFCSHPGGSRHTDGSWLNGDPVSGDEISIHPTFGDYTESISRGGAWSNQAWGTYNHWDGIAWQHADGSCSIRASFRINGVTAQADYWPCPVKTDRSLSRTDPDNPQIVTDIAIWSVRIWLNRTKVEDELDIECTYESPAIPIEDQGPPPSSTTPSQPETTQEPQPTQAPPSGGENPPPANDKPAPQPTNNNPAPTTSKPTPTINKPTPTINKPTPTTTTAPTTTTTTTTSPPAESDDEPSQPPVSVPDTEEEEQASTPKPAVADDISEDDVLEEESSDESDDLLESAEEGSDAADLLEEAETSTPTRVGQERPTDSEEQTQIARPSVPRTGTGGAATESTGSRLAIALTASVAAAAAVGIVSLAWYRRLRKPQNR